MLWADRFDEAAAAIFVTEFRRAGLRTCLVRAAGQSDAGAHGLTLVPDMNIDQARALAERAACVVIPCNTPAIQQLQVDPRVSEFLAVALTDDVKLVVGQQAEALVPCTTAHDSIDLIAFSDQLSVPRLARRIAVQLVTAQVRVGQRKVKVSLARPQPL